MLTCRDNDTPNAWTLTPDMVRDIMGKAPGQVGAVMPVMPFGQPIDIPAWQAFHEETGIPVVIDAAARFSGRVGQRHSRQRGDEHIGRAGGNPHRSSGRQRPLSPGVCSQGEVSWNSHRLRRRSP